MALTHAEAEAAAEALVDNYCTHPSRRNKDMPRLRSWPITPSQAIPMTE